MDTRSGELLSALLAIGMSVSLFFSGNSPMAKVMSNALPEWGILALICSLFSLVSVFRSEKWQALSRFLSGSLWGTVVLVYLSQEQYGAIFASAIVLFVYDIITVITKGRFTWIRRSNS